MSEEPSRGIDRREFVRSAVAIGGASALTACLDRESATDDTAAAASDPPRFPRGDPAQRPDGQHVWNDYIVRDAHGNTIPPQHQIILGLQYEGSTPPESGEREQVESALTMLDTAFQWGTGGDTGASFTRGLFWMLGYTRQYFDTVGSDPPSVPTSADVLEELGQDAGKADAFDAVLVMASDVGSVVLAAEAALTGEVDEVNGLSVDATFDGVFSVADRRTGVIGKGLPADNLDEDRIPDSAPLSMGFRSGFGDNQAPESRVTIQDGAFAGGTTIQLSRLEIDLERWYDQDTDARVAEMFCPAHDPDEVGETAESLGNDSGIRESDVDNIPDHAEEYGRVGHSQKVASARDEDFQPRILRRTEGVATDDGGTGAAFNFLSVQRDLEDFIDARRAMHVDEYDVDVPAEEHGIVDYLTTVSRGSYLVPPRELAALPNP